MHYKNIKVLYDHQIFSNQEYGGISKYFSECINEFYSHDMRVEPVVGTLFTRNHHLSPLLQKRLTLPKFKGVSRVNKFLNRLYKHFIHDFDLVHATYYFDKDLYTDKKLVVSVHDMIPEIYPNLFFKGNPHKAKYKYCQQADCIVAVSYNTKKDLINIYNIPEDKIKVVYHGIDLGFVQSNIQKINNIPEKYLLFVGQRNGYKNFMTLLRAFSKLVKNNNELCLVCAGPPATKAEKNDIHELKLENRVKFYHPTDEQLRWLYRQACAFVYPSLYEGFGIPILEGLAQKCPIVVANSSCFPEIAQDSAIYFSPHSESSLLNALDQTLHDKEGNKQRADIGLKICKKLTWYKAASELSQIYKEIL